MFLGASSPANRPRPQLVDLNLVPAEYRRKPFPIVTVGLSLFTLGALLLLYALYYARSYSNLEIAQLSARVAQGQAIVQTATGDPAALARQDKLRAMRDDYQVLAQRQINWGDVFQTIADVPSGVLVRSASQAGFGVTINGSAINQEAAANYLQQLKNSGLFVNASIQVQPAREPLAFITPTPPPTPVRSESTPPSGPTSAPAIAAAQPSVRPSETARPSQPTATFTESPRLTATATAPPTITLTPTRTGTPQPTSTPAYDFALISVVQVAAANPNAPNSDIKGQVLDAKGKGVAGLTIEIDSEGSPAWSAQTTTAGDGTFSFNVNHGKFQVEVIGGRSQTAKDLYTGADGTPGTWGYQLVFAETFTGPIPTVPPSLYTPTWTPTPDPTATITPVAPGANIASYGCTSAYLVQNGQRVDITGSTNPSQAIDGNMSTEWNSQVAPTNGTQVIWSWSLYGGSYGKSPCAGAGLPDSQDLINGIQLFPDQNPAGNTVHELWLYSDPGCTNNLASNGGAYFTWQQYTNNGSVLSLAFNQLPVRCVLIRTLVDPSYVAWWEVQIFQALPPPNGFPTFTATPVSTPTPTITPTFTPTATPCSAGTCTPTPTLTVTPTATVSPTVTFPPTSTPTWTSTATLTPVNNSGVFGTDQNVAPYSSLMYWTTQSAPLALTSANCQSSNLPPGNPCAVINDPSTSFWAPQPNAPDPQFVLITLDSQAFRSNANVVDDVKVLVWSTQNGSSEVYTVGLGTLQGTSPLTCTPPSQPAVIANGVWIDCPVVSPTPGANVVQVGMSNKNGREDGSYGIREVKVFAPTNLNSFSTVTPTPTSSQKAPAVVQRQSSIGAGRPTAAAGLGRGPGLEEVNEPHVPVNGPAQPRMDPLGQASAVNPSPSFVGTPPPPPQTTLQRVSTNAGAPITGPVDFTIIVEVASGKGYP